MSGYSSEELLTMNVLDVEAVVSASSFAFHMQKVIAQGQGRFETQHRHKDGSLFEVSISAQYQKTEGGRFVVFLEDITKNKATTDQIQSLQLKQAVSEGTEKQLQTALDTDRSLSIAVGIVMVQCQVGRDGAMKLLRNRARNQNGNVTADYF
jgi:hypothetical protein